MKQQATKGALNMENKDWYKSKLIWIGVITAVLGTYETAINLLAQGCTSDPVGLCYHLPAIPTWLYTILGVFGVGFRKTTNTVIK